VTSDHRGTSFTMTFPSPAPPGATESIAATMPVRVTRLSHEADTTLTATAYEDR
jgi:hypothetical protein